MHTIEDVEHSVVGDGGLGAIGARVVELDTHVAGQRRRLLDAQEQVSPTYARSIPPTGSGASDELPTVEDHGQVRVIHLSHEAEQIGAGAAESAVVVVLKADG